MLYVRFTRRKRAGRRVEVAHFHWGRGKVFEALFRGSKMIDGYEAGGFWGVCRVAKAFRVLYGVGDV